MYICSQAPWTSVQLFAFESLLVTSVCVMRSACAGLWPCLLLPYKARERLDTEERGEAEHHPGVTARLNPEAERPRGAHAIRSCPQPPHHYTQSMRYMLQLIWLAVSSVHPSPFCLHPSFCWAKHLVYPFFSLLSPVGVFSVCVVCLFKGTDLRDISGRFQWAIKLNNDVFVWLSAAAFNFFRVVGWEPEVRMKMT